MVGGPPYFLLLMFLIGLSCNSLSLAQPMFWISEVYNNFYSFNDTFVEIYDGGLGNVTLSNISLELERQNKKSVSVSLNDMMTDNEGFLVLSLNNADQVMRNVLEKIQNETVNLKLIMADKPNQTEIIDVFKKEKGWSDVISCFRNESAVNAIVLVGSEPSKGKINNCPLSPVRLDLVMFRTPFNLTVQLISHGIKNFPLTNHVFNFFKDETSVKMFSLEKYSTKNGKVNVTLDISQTFNMTSTYSINLELKINQWFVTLESLYFGAAPVPAVNLSHSFKTYPDKNPAQWVSPVYLQLVPSQSPNFASCYCEVSASTYNPFVSIRNSAARTKKCLEKCNDIISMSPKYDAYKYQPESVTSLSAMSVSPNASAVYLSDHSSSLSKTSASVTSSSASPIVSATNMSQGATSLFGMSSSPSGTPESSTSLSGTPESSTSLSGTPESSTSLSGTPESSTSLSGTPENSTPLSGTPESSTSLSGTPESSTSLSGTPESSTSLSGTPESSTSLSGTPESSTSLSGTPESSTSLSGTPESSTSLSGTPESSTSLSGTPESSTSLSGTPENSTSLSGTPENSTTLFTTSESLFNNPTSLSATSTSPSKYPTSSEASKSSSETSPTSISPSSIRMSNTMVPITDDTTTISSASYSLVTNKSVITNSSNEDDYRTSSILTAAQTTETSTILASTRKKTNNPVTSTPTFAGSTQRPRLNLYINEFRFGQESYMGNWIELKEEQSRSRQPGNSYALMHYNTSHGQPTTLLLDHVRPTTKEGLFFILYNTTGANLLIRGLSSNAGLLKLVYKHPNKSEELVDCVAYQIEGTVLDTELAKQCILHEVKQVTRREYQQKWTIGRCSKQFEVLEPSPSKTNRCPTRDFSHQIYMKILKTSPSKNFKTHFLTSLVQKLSADEGCMLSTAFFLDFFFNTSMDNINVHAHLAAPDKKKLDAVFMCYKTLFHKTPIKLQIGSDMVSVYRCHNSSCILTTTNKAPVAVSKTKTILAIVIPLLVFVVCLIGSIYMYMRHKRKSLLSVLGVARYDADQDDLLVNMEEVGRQDTNFQNPTYSQLSVY